jgi:hypothetical protein
MHADNTVVFNEDLTCCYESCSRSKAKRKGKEKIISLNTIQKRQELVLFFAGTNRLSILEPCSCFTFHLVPKDEIPLPIRVS